MIRKNSYEAHHLLKTFSSTSTKNCQQSKHQTTNARTQTIYYHFIMLSYHASLHHVRERSRSMYLSMYLDFKQFQQANVGRWTDEGLLIEWRLYLDETWSLVDHVERQ